MSRVAIILPLYNEADIIEASLQAIEQAVRPIPHAFEFILVDDGSTDDTWHTVERLAKERKDVSAISLSRNFGKEQALFAGIKHTDADAAIIMDADLQHPPTAIVKLVETWQRTKCDVVHAVKETRKNESVRNPLFVRIFYFVYRISTGIDMTGASDFKLISRRVINSYGELRERDLFFRGLVPWLGFTEEKVAFTVEKRSGGQTKWNPIKRCLLGIHAITSFSALPLQIVTIIGILFAVGAGAMSVYTIYEWWIGEALEGFTTIILLLLFIGATLMISLGIIGQYIARIYEEVKERPHFVVKASAGTRKYGD